MALPYRERHSSIRPVDTGTGPLCRRFQGMRKGTARRDTARARGTRHQPLRLRRRVAGYLGYTIYKIDRAVHHVAIAPSLLATTNSDLLAVVEGPRHSEEIYAFHTTSSRTNVLTIPSNLEVPGAAGTPVALSSLNIHSPALMIAGLRHMGIPVGHYVGVDLHTVSPDSRLGMLATGKISVTSLISDPTGTSSLIESVASHVYLGPGTPTSALLSLMKVPTGRTVAVPTLTDSNGRVVLAAPFADILKKFL